MLYFGLCITREENTSILRMYSKIGLLYLLWKNYTDALYMMAFTVVSFADVVLAVQWLHIAKTLSQGGNGICYAMIWEGVFAPPVRCNDLHCSDPVVLRSFLAVRSWNLSLRQVHHCPIYTADFPPHKSAVHRLNIACGLTLCASSHEGCSEL